MVPSAASDYRLAPALVARLLGSFLVLAAVAIFAATAVVALAGLSARPLVALVVIVGLGLLGLGWWLRSSGYVVRFDIDGYLVRLVRGAGVRRARWVEVERAATTTLRGIDCVVLHLRDGRTTTIPVRALDVDPELFVREVQQRLQDGHGLRPY